MVDVVNVAPGRTVLAGADIGYFPDFLCVADADRLLHLLTDKVSWNKTKVKMFGKVFVCRRLVAFYGDPEAIYNYSGISHTPLPWLPELMQLKQAIEKMSGYFFNSALLNLYRDGSDSMGWHRDNEPELGTNPVIASVSLGSTRRFVMRHGHQPSVSKLELNMTHGSLLLMYGETQHLWRHAVPKTNKIVAPRLNLTYRKILTRLQN